MITSEDKLKYNSTQKNKADNKYTFPSEAKNRISFNGKPNDYDSDIDLILKNGVDTRDMAKIEELQKK